AHGPPQGQPRWQWPLLPARLDRPTRRGTAALGDEEGRARLDGREGALHLARRWYRSGDHLHLIPSWRADRARRCRSDRCADSRRIAPQVSQDADAVRQAHCEADRRGDQEAPRRAAGAARERQERGAVMAKIQRSDKLQFINRFNTGTKREFVGKPVDFIGEPQAWEAVVLPLNYARARGAPNPQDNANGWPGKAALCGCRARALRLPGGRSRRSSRGRSVCATVARIEPGGERLRNRLRWCSVLCAVLGAAAVAQAQGRSAYPDRAVRPVVALPAGGRTNALSRQITQELGEALGQSVVIENKPGAGGTIAWNYVAASEPDGYTLLMAENALGISQALYKKTAFDPVKDYDAIAAAATSPLVLAVANNVPANSVAEL